MVWFLYLFVLNYDMYYEYILHGKGFARIGFLVCKITSFKYVFAVDIELMIEKLLYYMAYKMKN